MLNYFQVIVIGSIQGITELFPISSLGHSIILPKLLGWPVNQKDPFFLIFLVATHAATALTLFIYFWDDWKNILSGIIRSVKDREIKESDTYAKLGWLLVVGTIPAGILALMFEDELKTLFAAPQLVANVLIINGLMLFSAELLRRKRKVESVAGDDKRIAKLSWFQVTKIGLLQSLALIPGFSRTGSTITGGLSVGLSHEDAARFSFLLATPIIGAAAVLKLPELLTQAGLRYVGPTVVGALFAALFAYLSVKFLTKYFQTKKLTPFAIYCLVVGVALSLLFMHG